MELASNPHGLTKVIKIDYFACVSIEKFNVQVLLYIYTHFNKKKLSF